MIAEVDAAALAAAVGRVELRDVYISRMAAERFGELAVEAADVQIEKAVHVDAPRLEFTFTFRCRLTGEGDEHVAGLDCSAVGVFEVGGPEVELPLVHAIGDVVAFPAVFPYLRATLQDLAQRLGIVGFVLGLYRSNSEQVFLDAEPGRN